MSNPNEKKVITCNNCKFYTPEKNKCNHFFWHLCTVRDDEGFVSVYNYHVLK